MQSSFIYPSDWLDAVDVSIRLLELSRWLGRGMMLHFGRWIDNAKCHFSVYLVPAATHISISNVDSATCTCTNARLSFGPWQRIHFDCTWIGRNAHRNSKRRTSGCGLAHNSACTRSCLLNDRLNMNYYCKIEEEKYHKMRSAVHRREPELNITHTGIKGNTKNDSLFN